MLNSKEFVRELQLRHESAWMNPNVGSAETALGCAAAHAHGRSTMPRRGWSASLRSSRRYFPRPRADRGLIESPLTEIEHMRAMAQRK